MAQSVKDNNKTNYSTAQINLIKEYCAVLLTYIITWFPIIIRLFLAIGSEGNRYSTGIQISGIISHLALLSQVVTQYYRHFYFAAYDMTSTAASKQ